MLSKSGGQKIVIFGVAGLTGWSLARTGTGKSRLRAAKMMIQIAACDHMIKKSTMKYDVNSVDGSVRFESVKKRSILGASPGTGREAAPDLNFQGLPNVAIETEG